MQNKKNKVEIIEYLQGNYWKNKQIIVFNFYFPKNYLNKKYIIN